MQEQSLQNNIDQEVSKIALAAGKLPGIVVIHDLRDWTVAWISQMALDQLGITANAIVGKHMDLYHNRFFNPEDAKDYVPKILGLLQRNNDDEILTYFQQVRLSDSPDWKWHMSSTRIFMRNDENIPLLTITMSFPIDAMHHMTTKAARLLEENNFLRKNYHLYAMLSKRECEVLRHLALGNGSAQTAKELFISQHTVETHRKNIRQKLNTSSYYELCQYARAFDLI